MNHRRHFLRLSGLLAVISVLLSACGGGSTIAQPKPLTELPAPAYRMQTIWRTDGGDGAGKYDNGFLPAVADGRVYVANSDGYVMAINLSNGRKIWRARTGNPLVAGPSISNGVLLLGTRDGQVVALSADSGHRLWTADLSSEVIAAPGANNDTAVARTVDGRLVALDLTTGQRRWTVERTVPNLTLQGTSSPEILGKVVYAGMDSGKVIALDLATGEQRWEQTVAVPEGRSELDRIVDVDANPLTIGNVLYAVSAGGSMVAMSVDGGRILWKHDIAAETGLAANAKDIFTTDRNSVVWGVNRSTGDPNWKQDALEYRKLSAPAIYKGDVLVGDYEGYLHWLSADDGSIIARGRPFKEAIRAQPVVAGDRVIVLGADGEVAAVRFTAAGS